MLGETLDEYLSRSEKHILLQTRKELTKGNFRTLHWNWGSLLLGLGVVIGIVGPVNTYIRVGQFLTPSLHHRIILQQ